MPGWPIVRQWTKELVSAISWLYLRGVQHLDLKLENVMMDGTPEEVEAGTGRLVVVDFGLHKAFPARVVDPHGHRATMHTLDEGAWYPANRQSRWVEPTAKSNDTPFGGNIGHLAPELHQISRIKRDLQQATDHVAVDYEKQPVFSLGALLYEMCMDGEHPVPEYPLGALPTGNPEYLGPAERLPVGGAAGYPAAFVELVHEMVACNPRERPSMAEVVERVEQLPK